MRFRLDAHLPPQACRWLQDEFGVEADSLIATGDFRLRDPQVYERARHPGTVILTKDRDFVDLVTRRGPPPQVLLLTIGNTSNDELHRVLRLALPRALSLLSAGEPVVEIGGHS